MTVRQDEGFFSARDNLRLFWESRLPVQPRAHLGIVHGYGDHCGRYKKTIAALVAEGFAVHAFDYRGHGQADGRRGFCDRFSDLVDDLDLFWRRVRQAAGEQKAFLLAHSNGGLMAIHWLARAPEGVSGLILSAPYLRLALRPPRVKVLGGHVLNKVVPWIQLPTGLTPEHLTGNAEEQRAVAKDPLYNRALTPRWFLESSTAQAEAMRLAPTLRLPLFLLCGGRDGVASVAAMREFFEKVESADKSFKEYQNMRHEPLNEVGQQEVWKDISDWISVRL